MTNVVYRPNSLPQWRWEALVDTFLLDIENGFFTNRPLQTGLTMRFGHVFEHKVASSLKNVNIVNDGSLSKCLWLWNRIKMVLPFGVDYCSYFRDRVVSPFLMLVSSGKRKKTTRNWVSKIWYLDAAKFRPFVRNRLWRIKTTSAKCLPLQLVHRAVLPGTNCLMLLTSKEE